MQVDQLEIGARIIKNPETELFGTDIRVTGFSSLEAVNKFILEFREWTMTLGPKGTLQ